MIELPPAAGIFSSTTTLQPAFFASMAAARPAKPEPTTSTSTVSSHFCGTFVAITGEAISAAPAAMEPPMSERREI